MNLIFIMIIAKLYRTDAYRNITSLDNIFNKYSIIKLLTPITFNLPVVPLQMTDTPLQLTLYQQCSDIV